MTRVLHIIDRTTPTDCLDQLALLAGEDDRVASVGPPPAYREFTLPVRAVHCPLGIAPLGGGRLARQFPDADVIHAWSFRALEAGEAFALRGTRCRLVLSLPNLPQAHATVRLPRRLRDTSLVATVPTAVSREAMIAAGAPAEAVHVLPPPAPPIADAPVRRSRVRSALGLSQDDRLIVAPAEMTRSAGHVHAIWAHAIVRQIHPHVRLMLPGGGPVRDHVRFFAGTTGYNDEIFLTEDRFCRADVLAAADVAALLFEKDCGVSALVASMAAGVPIAAGRTPDVAECAPHAEAALLADPGDPRAATAAVLELIDSPQLARRMAERARQIAMTRFSPQAAREALQVIYHLVGA